MKKRYQLIALTVFLASCANTQPNNQNQNQSQSQSQNQNQNQSYSQTPKGQAFIENMVGQYGYTKPQLENIFSQVKRDDKILEKISHPKEKTTPWYKYQRIFLDQGRIQNGLKFYRKHQNVLQEAYQKYGVSPFIISAIIGVETRYGKVMGKDKIITALSTIGFDYPKREKFFISELRAYLQMAAQERFDLMTPKGSYAGAMGMAQFMPSSFLNYAVDYEGDGKRDLWNNPNDAIFSVANYLKSHKWKRDGAICEQVLNNGYNGTISHHPFSSLSELKRQGLKPIGNQSMNREALVGVLELDGGDKGTLSFITYNNFSVITTYNTSPMYAMAVKNLAEVLEKQWILNEGQ